MLKNKLVHTLLAVVIIAAIFSSSVVTFYADVYFNVDGYTFEPVNNNYVSLVSSDLEANGTDLVVPNTAYSRFVGSVKEYAFMNSEITSVSFRQANGLSEIGRYAFYNCKNIQELYIPYRVKQIGTAAFSGCEQLETVDFASGSTVIPAECFAECGLLNTITLSDAVTSIERFAFYNCSSLSYMEIPSRIASIDENAFYGCTNLVLGVYKDTYALQYAEDNKIDHIILDGDKTGDVNGDGVVDILDATEIQKYAAESTDFTDEQFELGDINDDGYCDVIDALLVQKSVIGAYEIPPIVIRY